MSSSSKVSWEIAAFIEDIRNWVASGQWSFEWILRDDNSKAHCVAKAVLKNYFICL